MNICICGGGNLGHVITGYLAHKGYEVSLLTRHPEGWSDTLQITTPDGTTLKGSPTQISADPSALIPQADVVLFCLPGFAIAETLKTIRPHLQSKTAVGSVVSNTGFFFEALSLLSSTQTLFGFQRVPFIARVEEYGHSARLLGYKESLSVAVVNGGAEIADKLSAMFDTPVTLLGSHYEVSLSNSNPLLHPARLYSLWKDWRPGVVYPRQALFYEEWSEEAAQLYIDMDSELQSLLAVLPVKKGALPTVRDYYESHDAASLAQKLRSIEAFKGILAPMKLAKDGYVPDFQSRYFTEDFPYGLAIIYRLCQDHQVNVPTIECVLKWGMSIINNV